MSEKYNKIENLENRFNWLRKKKQDVVYRITESPSWYNIRIRRRDPGFFRVKMPYNYIIYIIPY